MNMLPLPGAPSSSWAMYRARLKAAFDGADARVCLAFWLFGKPARWPWSRNGRPDPHAVLTL